MGWFKKDDTSPTKELVGRTFVYTPYNYAVRVVSVSPDGPEGPWMQLETFESNPPARSLELPLTKRHLLRDPVDQKRAVALEEIIIHARPVASQAAHLDLRLYILGTLDQAAAAVATLMDRAAADPPDMRAQADLQFLGMKILGELAYARGAAADVAAYVTALQERRRATPTAERTVGVEPPTVPPLPTRMLTSEDIASPGWHVAQVSITGLGPWLLGDTHTDDFQLVHEHKLPAASGDWFLSVHQLGDDRVDWVVLSHGAAYTVETRNEALTAIGPGGPNPLTKAGETTSETGWLGFWVDPPADAGRAVNHSPPGAVLIWPYGLAIHTQMYGSFDVYGVPPASGLLVWATHTTEVGSDKSAGVQEQKIRMGAPDPNLDSLIVIDPAEHGMNAAARLESQTGGLPFAVTGYGLFLAVKAPAIVVNIGTTLLIGRRDGRFFVIRASVNLGSSAASQLPTATPGARTFTTGLHGPTITLEPQVESLDAVFLPVARVAPELSQWRVLGSQVSSLPFLTGTSLESVTNGDAGPFIMAPGLSNLGLIKLDGPYSRRPRPEDLLFAGARLDGEGSISSGDGRVPWYGVTYDVEGITWKQRFYVLPIEDGAGGCMTLKVQTPASKANTFFSVADEVAADFWGPISSD